MSRQHPAPLLAPLAFLSLLFSTAALPAQIVSRTASTRTPSNSWRSIRNDTPRSETARYASASFDTSLLAPSNLSSRPSGSRYQFLRQTMEPNRLGEIKVRRVSDERRVQLPPPPIDRIYRGQEPADTRPRLNGAPGEIVREEIVPADTRPRLNSPPDVFRSQPRSFSSPACQSPTYYRSEYPSSKSVAPTTRYYNSPANPGGLPESRYEIGRGIIGQPTLYVRKQPIRNFVRWLTY